MLAYTSSTRSTVAKLKGKRPVSTAFLSYRVYPALITRSFSLDEPLNGITVFERGVFSDLLRNDRDEFYLKDEHFIWPDCTTRATGTISKV